MSRLTPSEDTNWAILLVIGAIAALVLMGIFKAIAGILQFVLFACLVGAAILAIVSLLSKRND